MIWSKRKYLPFDFVVKTATYHVHFQLFCRSSPCPISSPEDYCSPGTVSPKARSKWHVLKWWECRVRSSAYGFTFYKRYLEFSCVLASQIPAACVHCKESMWYMQTLGLAGPWYLGQIGLQVFKWISHKFKLMFPNELTACLSLKLCSIEILVR